MDYIYSELNNKLSQNTQSDCVSTQFENSTTTTISNVNDNTVSVDVNTQNIVRLVTVKKDSDASDDVIQTLRLMAFNKLTNQFDIPVGEDINIDHRNYSQSSNITHAKIGGAVVPAHIDSSGQLVLQYIPISSIVDTYYEQDSSGNYEQVYVDSVIDGND